MKSITRFKLLIICAATAIASFAAFAAGCAIGAPSTDSILDENNAKNQCVTYYAAGGSFDSTTVSTEKNIYYTPDSYIASFTDKNGESTMYRLGYVFNGWYYVKLSDGKPMFDENGIAILSDEEVDFNKKIQQGEHWYIAADWIRDQFVEIRLGGTDTITGKDNTKYEPDRILSERNFGRGGTVTLNYNTPMESTDYTFLQYYTDINCTQALSGAISRPETGNAIVYAKYIKGVYDVVRNADQVITMLLNTASDKTYYIYTAEAEAGGEKVIDCKGKVISFYTGDFNCKIEGNGYTLKNLEFSNNSVSAGQAYSIFGAFTAKASVKNLTVSNVKATINVGIRTNVAVYLVCHGIEDGATLENFNINDIELEIKGSKDVALRNVSASDTESWICGGVRSEGASKDTDNAFMQKYTGFTVSNYKLTLKGEQLIGYNA